MSASETDITHNYAAPGTQVVKQNETYPDLAAAITMGPRGRMARVFCTHGGVSPSDRTGWMS